MAKSKLKEPLLKKKYYENCSGCKVEQLKELKRGFPIRELVSIWIVVLGTGVQHNRIILPSKQSCGPASKRSCQWNCYDCNVSFLKPLVQLEPELCKFSWAEKRQNAAFLPGDQLVFLVLNVVDLIGVLMTFKPFLAQRQE